MVKSSCKKINRIEKLDKIQKVELAQYLKVNFFHSFPDDILTRLTTTHIRIATVAAKVDF